MKEKGMSDAGAIIFVVIGFLTLLALVAVMTFGIRWVTAEPKGKLTAREEILSGPNRIVQYNHFFDLCASIQGLEGQLDASMLALKLNNDPEENSRLSANVTGLQGIRAQAIAQYNADANKDYTAGQFRDSDLPYQLESGLYTGVNKTSCVA